MHAEDVEAADVEEAVEDEEEEQVMVVRNPQSLEPPSLRRQLNRPNSVLQSIKSQTVRGSRTKIFSRVASGNLVTRYGLNKAPVYRERFPVNGRYLSVPEKRAVRISSERVSLLNSDGNLCLLESSSVLRSLKKE